MARTAFLMYLFYSKLTLCNCHGSKENEISWCCHVAEGIDLEILVHVREDFVGELFFFFFFILYLCPMFFYYFLQLVLDNIRVLFFYKNFLY